MAVARPWALLSSVEFVEGRTRHPTFDGYALPIQWLITASYTDQWESQEDFLTCPVSAVEFMFSALAAPASDFLLASRCEWVEVDAIEAKELLARHLRYAQAYHVEIRDDATVASLCERLLPLSVPTRYFTPGESLPLTADWVIDFGLVRLTENEAMLFVTVDED